MGVYEPEKIKKHICAGLLAHVDAGKTTLSEALLYLAGSIWDTFDGTSWSAQAKPAPEEPDYFGDNVESGEDAAELCARTRMTVTFDEVYTRTVFWPEQTEKLDIEIEKSKEVKA